MSQYSATMLWDPDETVSLCRQETGGVFRAKRLPARSGGMPGAWMSILSRYILRQVAGALLLIILSLTGVVWIAVALRQIELVTSQGQNIARFLGITLLAIPTMMALIAPIALLIAAIHVLNKLSGDSELIIMTAGGMNTWALLKPLGLLGVIVAGAVGFVLLGVVALLNAVIVLVQMRRQQGSGVATGAWA